MFFNECCVYDRDSNTTLLYYQNNEIVSELVVCDLSGNVIKSSITGTHSRKTDKCIFIKDDIVWENCEYVKTYRIKMKLNRGSDYKVDTVLDLKYPFEKCALNLDKNHSAIISIICRNYYHRLDEWIDYNLRLGFSGIVIFNNDENKRHSLNEGGTHNVYTTDMKNLIEKYGDKLTVVNFPYTSIESCYDSIQRISLTIGAQAYKNKCRNIAFIDPDEFIHLSVNPTMKIEDFLQRYQNTINMSSNLLTNRSNEDIIDNNVLEIAKYVGPDKYKKIILYTPRYNREFIMTPHNYPGETILSKDVIVHYHTWLNDRLVYDEDMIEFNGLQTLMSSTTR
jgi:hypothetical protein